MVILNHLRVICHPDVPSSPTMSSLLPSFPTNMVLSYASTIPPSNQEINIYTLLQFNRPSQLLPIVPIMTYKAL